MGEGLSGVYSVIFQLRITSFFQLRITRGTVGYKTCEMGRSLTRFFCWITGQTLFLSFFLSTDVVVLMDNFRTHFAWRLSVRTITSIENETQRNARLSVRTSTKKGTNMICHIFGATGSEF